MFFRVSGSLTRFWLIRMTRQIQDDMSYGTVVSCRRVQAKAKHVTLFPFGYNSIVIPNFSFGEVRIR